MLQQLKDLIVDRLHLDELLALQVFAKGLRAEYETLSIDVPEWLDDRVRQLGREINLKRADTLERLLKEAEAEQARLQTPDEKRAAITGKIEALRKQLAETR